MRETTRSAAQDLQGGLALGIRTVNDTPVILELDLTCTFSQSTVLAEFNHLPGSIGDDLEVLQRLLPGVL